MTKTQFTKEKPLQVLNIGTKILLKDVMDQYLRSLGEVKTFYASKMSVALETWNDKQPQVVFCEASFPEGSALDFIEMVGGLDTYSNRYFVLATESAEDDIVALASEKCVDEILIKPFSTDTIHKIIERYMEKVTVEQEEWIEPLRKARQSEIEKRWQEAEEGFSLASKKFHNEPRVLTEAAAFYLRRSLPNAAQPILVELLKHSPESVRLLHLAGLCNKKMQKYKEAADCFSKANRLSPANTIRRAELADTYLQLAEEQLQAALKNDGENGTIILHRARLFLARKEYSQLVTYLDAKKPYLSDAHRKESEQMISVAKKMGGLI